MNLEERFTESIKSWEVQVRLTPWANKNEIFSMLWENIFKIRIKAQPEKWKANKELISFLAKILKINKNNLEIIWPKLNQNKIIKLKK